VAVEVEDKLDPMEGVRVELTDLLEERDLEEDRLGDRVLVLVVDGVRDFVGVLEGDRLRLDDLDAANAS
jgi:putative protein kinase ArgK-like GTPase of G3E family